MIDWGLDFKMNDEYPALNKEVSAYPPWLVLSAVFAWMLIFPFFGPLSAALHGGSVFLYCIAFLGSHALTMWLGGTLLSAQLRHRAAAWIAAALLSVSTCLIAFTRLSDTGMTLMYCGMGIGSAVLVFLGAQWLTLLRRPALVVGGSLVVANLPLILTSSLLPPPTEWSQPALTCIAAAASLLPLIAGALLGRFQPWDLALSAPKHFYSDPLGRPMTPSILLRSVIGIFLFALIMNLAGGLMYNYLTPLVSRLYPETVRWGLLFYCCGALIASIVRNETNVALLAFVAFSLLGVGFTLSFESAPGWNGMIIGYWLIMVGLGMSMVVYWILLLIFGYRLGLERTFGIGLGVNMGLLAFVGYIAGTGILGSPLENPLASNLFLFFLFLSLPVLYLNARPAADLALDAGFELHPREVALASQNSEESAARDDNAAPIAPEPAADPLIASLTPTEKRVYSLICSGCIDQEIADEMVISKNTVKFHVRNILRKAGANNRRELLSNLLNRD